MNVKGILIFTAGLVVGGSAGYFVAKKLIEKKTNAEIESIREAYRHPEGKCEENVDIQAETEIKNAEERRESEKTLRESVVNTNKVDYTAYATNPGEPDDYEYEEDEIPDEIKILRSNKPPYVIFPEEFGEEDGYETIEFTVYSDGIVADETGHIVKNIDEIVGRGNINRIGEYERDSVFVRNERLGCDYQVIQCIDTYEEFLEEHPECR